VPDIPGIEKFTGRVIHSHQYKNSEDFEGQRVMVIGNGPSGLDLTIALPEHAHWPVYLAQRTGIVLKPRYPYGLPKHGWMLLAQKLPNRLTRWLEQKAQEAQYSNVDRVGLKVPGPGQETGAAGTSGPELLHRVRQGAVKPVETPVNFERAIACLADGSEVEIDTLILATGFRPALDVLDIDFETDDSGLPVREEVDFPVYEGYLPHTGYEAKDHPGLYIAGVFYKGRGAMYNFNVEAEITVQQIQQRLAASERTKPLTTGETQ
jgi:cation diffusion facilitator CzcD-associated flavoprotein CzcO